MACFEGFLSFAFGGANVFQCTAAISGSGDWRGALHILRVPYLSTTAFGGTRKSGSWTYLRNMADWWLTIDYSQDEGFWSFRDIITVIYIICLHLSLYVNIWLPSKNSGNAPKDHGNHQSWHDLLWQPPVMAWSPVEAMLHHVVRPTVVSYNASLNLHPQVQSLFAFREK